MPGKKGKGAKKADADEGERWAPPAGRHAGRGAAASSRPSRPRRGADARAVGAKLLEDLQVRPRARSGPAAGWSAPPQPPLPRRRVQGARGQARAGNLQRHFERGARGTLRPSSRRRRRPRAGGSPRHCGGPPAPPPRRPAPRGQDAVQRDHRVPAVAVQRGRRRRPRRGAPGPQLPSCPRCSPARAAPRPTCSPPRTNWPRTSPPTWS